MSRDNDTLLTCASHREKDVHRSFFVLFLLYWLISFAKVIFARGEKFELSKRVYREESAFLSLVSLP